MQISYIDQSMRFVVIKVTKYKSHTLINVSGLYEVKLILLLSWLPYIAEYLDSWNTIIYFSYYYNVKSKIGAAVIKLVSNYTLLQYRNS